MQQSRCHRMIYLQMYKAKPLAFRTQQTKQPHHFMKQLIIKYALLIIITTLIIKIITGIITVSPPLLLSTITVNGRIRPFPILFFENILELVLNIIIVIIMKKDLRKENINSVPLLILTLFSGLIGVLFFLLAVYHNQLKRQIT